MTETAPLTVDHVYKRYDKKQVLNDVSLTLNQGEIFGLIGLNGVGKTTLIKIILTLSRPDQGSAQVFGRSSSTVEARRHLSYLPEKFQPSRHLRGREFLDLSLSYYGKKLDLDQARREVELLDLDPKALDLRIGAYSKGMGQKLGLAAAFLIDVPFLILDEPMSGLDPRARISLKQKLLSLKSQNKTVFFSSHILSDIDEICDRIGVIHGGELLYVGTPGAFKQRFPSDTLEKSFLSSIQFPVQ